MLKSFHGVAMWWTPVSASNYWHTRFTLEFYKISDTMNIYEYDNEKDSLDDQSLVERNKIWF